MRIARDCGVICRRATERSTYEKRAGVSSGVTEPWRVTRSLHRDRGLAAAQDELLNLARRGLRQLADERHRVRALEVRQAVARELPDLVGGRGGARLQDDERMRRLAPLRVG